MDAVVLLTALLLLADGSSQTATWYLPSIEACEAQKATLVTAVGSDPRGPQVIAVCYEEPVTQPGGDEVAE